jgi:hypothetical protein
VTTFTGKELETADLVVDAVYKGYRTEKGGTADPLVKMVGVSRQGGFRYRGNKDAPAFVILTSNLAESDWPDELDPTTGRFIYYGDNRQPGAQLHDTPRFGNMLLKGLFDRAHTGRRQEVPPVLVFTAEGPSRAFRFRGLAVPGYPGTPGTQDLIAIWKTAGAERFQNYRAVFTVLDEAVISREWVQRVGGGQRADELAPAAWKRWVESGTYLPLVAPRSKLLRSRVEQLPLTSEDRELVAEVHRRYAGDAFGFEWCAAELVKLLLPDVSRLDLTRPYRDGGRDGIGTVRLGQGHASLDVSFALEAKCNGFANSVGVRELSRLISRIKHREFGILVTTSYVHDQAYREVVDDGHPVILLTAIDIAALIRRAGYSTPELVKRWLDAVDALRHF